MRLQNTSRFALLVLAFFVSTTTFAQSKTYQRKSKKAEATATAATPAAATEAPADAAKKDSEKLDIKNLEQKYWAPKDTDFSVVQNRTYTKAKRYALSLEYGPAVNDTWNSGMIMGVAGSYYFDERQGIELTYLSSNLTNSKSTDTFLNGLGGGSTAPDFNRPEKYYALGYNFVPFYAKMSVMGQKIIYFDMQITPHVGMSSYQQQNIFGTGATKSAFSYGLDITQYFFIKEHWAIRATLHDRWYKEDVEYYKTGLDNRSDTTNVQDFLMGVTYFF